MSEMNSNILKINMDDYLVDFVISIQGGSSHQPISVSKKNSIGMLLYRLIDRVPENCHFVNPVLPKKRMLEVEMTSIGAADLPRKRALTHYYLPVSKQREFESVVRDMFDELFFQFVEISHEYTEEQYVKIIDAFCERYGIDFAKHFDSLKKKHYRERCKIMLNPKNI